MQAGVLPVILSLARALLKDMAYLLGVEGSRGGAVEKNMLRSECVAGGEIRL